MRILLSLPLSITLAFIMTDVIHAQAADPIDEQIVNRGLTVQIREITRLPESRGLYPANQDTTGYARVSYVRDLADGRRFANDSRGFLYLIDDNNQPSLYADVAEAFPFSSYIILQNGFIGFEFHPEFASNGLFYTVHCERAKGNPATPHFIPPGFTQDDVTFHTIITEWHATNPAEKVFKGIRRELLRVAHVVNIYAHPFGHLEFNPTSKPGDPDYGLLYIGGGDLGFLNGGGENAENPDQLQRLDTLAGTILRINPLSPFKSGETKGIGDYSIPPINKLAADGDPDTLGEIYAYGFRNAHRLSWDHEDGTLFASDIGQSQVEEINIIHEGHNYGWPRREGFFVNGSTRPEMLYREVFPLSAEILNGQIKDKFTYPVVTYNHDERNAITGGVAYHGKIPALRGKFVFGDIPRGQIFAADLKAMKKFDDGIPQTIAPIEEIQLYTRDASGKRKYVTLWELIEAKLGEKIFRADLHIGQSRDGEIFVTSRQDGTIRMLVPDSD